MKLPWRRTADEEYAKDPKLKREEVLALQEWMTSNNHLPRVEEEMICHFLFACFYDVEQTKKVIDTYYTYKTTMPNFFDNWDPLDKELQDTVNNILIAGGMPEPDPDGNRVIVCKLNDTSTENFIYPACVKWLLMSCMFAMWNNGIQPGYVIVYDATGYSMSHMFKCSLSDIRNYINYGKNASPIRVVKIVFINTSPVVKKLISLVKPFLSKELINMMSFHTSAESYFGSMPRGMVPEDYGGTAPPLLTLHRDCIRTVIEGREYIMAEEKVRAHVSKKNGKGLKEEPKQDTSFKRLEID